MDTSDEGLYYAVIRTVCDTLSTQKTMVKIKVMSSVREFTDIKIFPQPADNIITIEHLERSIGKFVLYDTFGTAMKSFEIQDGKAIISTEELPAGLYILHLSEQSVPIIITH